MNPIGSNEINPTPSPALELADANQITQQLWVGGELDPTNRQRAMAQLDELMDRGIRSIIDCRMESNDIDWVTQAKAQIDYLSVGVEDAGYLMPDEWFDDGVTYALDQIGDNCVVLAHCQMGINRGPSMGFAILLAQGWDPIAALELIKSRRPIVRIAYAEDAIRWWLTKQGKDESEVLTQLRRARKWRSTSGVRRTIE